MKSQHNIRIAGVSLIECDDTDEFPLCAGKGCENPRPKREDWLAIAQLVDSGQLSQGMDVAAFHDFCHTCREQAFDAG